MRSPPRASATTSSCARTSKPPVAGEHRDQWAAAISAFAARPNTACKLSGLVTEAPAGTPQAAFVPVTDVILDAFGPQRTMFGSDWPVCLLAADYPTVVSLAESLTIKLSAAERTAVFAATASRVYGIGENMIDSAKAWRQSP